MQTFVQVVVDGVILGGFYALMAQGLALVFGIMRVINLAHGEALLLGAYLAWAGEHYFGLPLLLSLPLIAVAGYLFGYLFSRVLILPVLDRPQLMPLLVTFGLAFVIQGVLVATFTNTPRITPTFYSDSVLELLGVRVSAGRAIMLVAALVILALLSLFINRSKPGRAMKAAAQNREAARIVGIDVNRTYCAAFAIGTALAFLAGGLFSATQGFFPFLGALFTLKAFVIVVLGGSARISGLLAAAMFVGLVEASLSSYVPNIGTSLGTAAAFILVVVVLAVRPEGLSRAKVAG